MLNNIKSIYFLRKIFYNTNEKAKLELIKYNKSLQNKLKLSLINYIFFSEKYIIYESNNKGKEYRSNDDILIFKGEYKNGKRSGIGKEYNDNGEIIFEGEYKNGKRSGIGKEYNNNGEIKFEGEYLNGKQWNGKQISFSRELKKEYEIKNGISYNLKIYNMNNNIQGETNKDIGFSKIYNKKDNSIKYYAISNGKTKIYNSNKHLIYLSDNIGKNCKKRILKAFYDNGQLLLEAEIIDDKLMFGKRYDKNNKIMFEVKNGKGFFKFCYDEDNLDYIGEYLNGEKNGKGKEYDYNTKSLFKGKYLNGKRYGNGKEYYSNGKLQFEGIYADGVKNGKGKEYKFDGIGLLFEGEYLNGKRSGEGKEYNYDKKLIFEGEYLYGYRRKGREYDSEKLIYEGEYILGRKWEGKGYDINGNIIYELTNGNGIIKEYDIFDNKFLLVFEGEYKNGKKNGKGKEYDSYKNILAFEGEFKNGKRNGKGKEYNEKGKVVFEGEYINGNRYS